MEEYFYMAKIKTAKLFIKPQEIETPRSAVLPQKTEMSAGWTLREQIHFSAHGSPSFSLGSLLLSL